MVARAVVDGLTPDVGTVYFDNVVISRRRVSVNPSPIIWVATHEAGNLAEWGDGSGPSGGGLFNDGVHTVATSTERAHSGTRSMKMTINTTAAVDTAVRAFRWKESYTKQDLYYSAWYYFPQQHVPTTFWNIMQFKSELYDAGGAQVKNEPDHHDRSEHQRRRQCSTPAHVLLRAFLRRRRSAV